MTVRRRRKTETELASELRANRHAASEWSETPVHAVVAKQRAVVMSFRLPVDEFIALQKSAKANGETVSDFIRNAIRLRLRGELTANAVQIASGTQGRTLQATFLAPALSSGRSENPIQVGPDPDQVPRFANLTR